MGRFTDGEQFVSDCIMALLEIYYDKKQINNPLIIEHEGKTTLIPNNALKPFSLHFTSLHNIGTPAYVPVPSAKERGSTQRM
jgi:hypothetical protein